MSPLLLLNMLGLGGSGPCITLRHLPVLVYESVSGAQAHTVGCGELQRWEGARVYSRLVSKAVGGGGGAQDAVQKDGELRAEQQDQGASWTENSANHPTHTDFSLHPA